MVDINYFAVVTNVALAMILCFLWYGPIFGKQWVALMGWSHAEIETKMKEGMGPKYLLQAVGALVMSFVLAHTIIFSSAYLNVHGIMAGIEAAIWNWVGFVVPATIGTVLWEGKSWKLWFLNAGYFLVLLLIMGSVLAVWV
jgi:Protein of unknown function (DUF1761)